MTNEEWCDAEVTPKLREIATACQERGMAFIAEAEFAPGERAGTYCFSKDTGHEMRMLWILSKTAPNIDAFLINLIRYAEDVGLDVGSSMFLKDWAKK